VTVVSLSQKFPSSPRTAAETKCQATERRPLAPGPGPACHGATPDARWRPGPGPARPRQAGASWSQIGAALGTSKQAAWEAHSRWIDGQAEQNQRSGYEGLDDGALAAARALAGEPESA
jgi:hypothetical protein